MINNRTDASKTDVNLLHSLYKVRSGHEKSLESHILYEPPSCEQSNNSYFAAPSRGAVGSVLNSRLMRC